MCIYSQFLQLAHLLEYLRGQCDEVVSLQLQVGHLGQRIECRLIDGGNLIGVQINHLENVPVGKGERAQSLNSVTAEIQVL